MTHALDSHNLVPLLVAHGLERAVTQDTGIVDQNIHTAPLVDNLLDDLGAFTIRVIVGHGLTTGLLDLFYNQVCGLLAVRC